MHIPLRDRLSTLQHPLFYPPVQLLSIYGGVSLDSQLTSLNRIPYLDILVATPGRLAVLLAPTADRPFSPLSLARAKYLVLDEADRMLDLGFEKEMAVIGECLNNACQHALFSATWEGHVQELALRHFLTRGTENTLKVVVGSDGCVRVSDLL